MDAGRAAVADAPWRLSCRAAAGSEDGWTGLPGMVSPHARSSRSSSPPPGGEEDDGRSAVAAAEAPRLPPAPVEGVTAGVAFFYKETK